ncbi:MAG: cyclic nucleotide-binding domain-containing protein [candidate division Zixibacteria bacterium]|nr:cyclic nucleotide-binding domain-containing protein [candidate division Zixibacteria bacterium]
MGINEHLQKCYLCAGLDQDELRQLAEIISIRNLKKDEILFFQGDPAGGFYILLSGKVRIYKASAEGKEYTLHIIDPGQMFAEAAIFGGGGYPANCAAIEDSTIAFIPKIRFTELVQNSPQISLKMIGGLSSFVREFNQKLEELTLKEVSARLAKYIMDESYKQSSKEVNLAISKGQLANKLGTISETLSRNLKKLRTSNIIDVEGKTIKILDFKRLESIAEGEKV